VILTPRCLCCILNRRLNEIYNSKINEEEKLHAQKYLIRKCSSLIRKDLTTVELASLLYSELKKLIKDEDPYKNFKELSYKFAYNFSINFEKRISQLNRKERLKKIIAVSAFMNFLDPSTNFGLCPKEAFKKIGQNKLAKDESKTLFNYLNRTKDILFILDNAGEASVDLLLVKELSKMGINIKILAKGKPYQNDITYDEAIKLGFNNYGSLISTETDSEGIIEGLVPDHVVKLLERTDLIIAKGVANFESIYYKRLEIPSFHILATKCEVMSKIIGTKLGETAAFFLVKPHAKNFSSNT
jgi:uncharacterized protein with ATP-grasp and redox domains